VLIAEGFTVIIGGFIIVIVSLSTQPAASVTVTKYCPALNPEIGLPGIGAPAGTVFQTIV
jgi:hypothetical protein